MTTLVRWDPLRDVASLHTELSRLVSGLAEGTGQQTQAWVPSLDVWETADAVTYSFDLPGVSRGDISIEAEDGHLTVSASRQQASEIDSERFHRLERRYGAYSRTVGLPQGVAEDAIDATYENGVLTITVPKPEQPRPKRIQISVETPPPTVEATSNGDAQAS